MKNILFLILSFCFLSVLTKAQTIEDMNNLQRYYESFQYESVINEADSLLTIFDQIDQGLFERINTLKAASHFSLGKQRESRKTFLEILKINKNFQLDSIIYSPKLLLHFDQIKEEFLDISEFDENDNTNITEIQYDSLKIKNDYAGV